MTDDEPQSTETSQDAPVDPDVPETLEGGEDAGALVERTPADLAASAQTREQLRRRVVLPLLVPLLSIAMIAVLAINISRVFLAGGKTGALVAASVVTIGILGGAAFVSARPRMRSSSLTLVTSAVVLLAVGAGLTTLGASEDHGEEGGGGGYQEPEGDATSTVSVAALASLAFDPSNPTTAAGIVEITMTCDNCGDHTFLFDDSTYSGFELAVPDGPETGKVELPEGAFVFYCDIPGHREAGMEGTLTVTAAAGGETTTTSAPAG